MKIIHNFLQNKKNEDLNNVTAYYIDFKVSKFYLHLEGKSDYH